VSQFARNVFGCVILSAARVRRSRDERKSKDPENVSSAIQVQGILLKNIFSSESFIYGAMEGKGTEAR
jgi:hypothetical protein